MAERRFRVVFARSAWADLDKIVAYWTKRDEPERGEKYANDLPTEAARQLSDLAIARAGRFLRRSAYPEVQELLVFKQSYRILYVVHPAENIVRVHRFWHSHRDEPFR
jgi:plasmid stabilization system protein ParE